MQQITSQLEANQNQNKQNEYTFQLEGNNRFTISSNFESGNIRIVKQVATDQYILQAVKDQPNIYSKKSWFFFRIECSMSKKIKIGIQNVNIFESVIDYKKECVIVYKNQKQNEWKNFKVSLLEEVSNKNVVQLSLSLQFNFVANQPVYFSLSVPFTYTDNQIYFQNLKSRIPDKISYIDQLLTLTPENREVRLITISQYSETDNRNHKPVVLITSRIHPGQVTSSYCMLGIIESLLNPTSLQSYILRRLFEWKIVPMVNPDGVVAGNYRTNPQGQNLNRHYLDPNPDFHPAIHHIVNLMKTITQSKQKIQFYFDLHSHSNMKEAFIYGNALDQIEAQVYSRLFCKILEINTPYFKNHLCQFGTKHMKFRDRGEKMSKQGCGRVTALKIAKVIRSYTLQSTVMPMFYNKIHPKNCLSSIKNQKLKYQPLRYSVNLCYHQQKEAKSQEHLLVKANKLLGQAVLVSILDMFLKNPFSRLCDNFHEKQYLYLKKRLLRLQYRFKLKQVYLNFKSSLNQYSQTVQQLQKQIYEIWQKCNINKQFYCIINQPLEFKYLKQDQKQKKVRRSLNHNSKLSITESESISKLQNHLQLQNNQGSNTEHDKLSKLKVKLKTKLKHNSPYINIRSLISQIQQNSSKQSHSSIPKNHFALPAHCFLQPTHRLNAINSSITDKIAIPQYLNQNIRSFEVQNRKNTPLIKAFKEDFLYKKNEDNKSNMSQMAKLNKLKASNFYLGFLQRRKRTKTESKNEVELLPEIILPRSYSSLNNKIVPLSTNQIKKDRVSQSLSKVAGFQQFKKPIKPSLDLPSLDLANRILKKRRILFTQKIPGLK